MQRRKRRTSGPLLIPSLGEMNLPYGVTVAHMGTEEVIFYPESWSGAACHSDGTGNDLGIMNGI